MAHGTQTSRGAASRTESYKRKNNLKSFPWKSSKASVAVCKGDLTEMEAEQKIGEKNFGSSANVCLEKGMFFQLSLFRSRW